MRLIWLTIFLGLAAPLLRGAQTSPNKGIDLRPLYQKGFEHLTKQAGLPPLKESSLAQDDIEFRLWETGGLGDFQVGYVLRRERGVWTGKIIRMAAAIPFETTELKPASPWEDIWNHLLKNQALVLPDFWDLSKPEVGVLDGHELQAELVVRGKYRSYIYPSPEVYDQAECKMMVSLYDQFRRDIHGPRQKTPPAPSTNSTKGAREPYPERWWVPVAKEGAPGWEILPQEAKPSEVILSKRHELGLLSNFAATPFEFHSRRYASVEGFWQAMKYPENADDPRTHIPGFTWQFTRAQVEQMTAFEAKRAGDLGEEAMRKMGIGWVSFEGRHFDYKAKEPGEHYRLIVAAMREKLRQNPAVMIVLLRTGDLVLKPDHHQEPDAPPEWRYFEIWMQLRQELQEAAQK